MGILSNVKTKLGYFILDHIVTQDVIQQWKTSHHIEDLSPPTLYATGPMPSIERNTDRIDAKAVNASIQAQNVKVVRGRALDVPQEYLAPGKLVRWYREQENYVNRVASEDTVRMSAIKLQEELRRRLDGENQG